VVKRVSVVIPVLTHREQLQNLLESLRSQTLAADEFDVVVVHNSTNALEITPNYPFDLLSISEPAGYSYAARNAGIRVAEGEVLAFTDADCVADPGWLEGALAIIDQDSKVLVAGHIGVTASSEKPSLAEKHQMTFAFDQETNVAYKRGIPTANLVAHREAFVDVGLFNPDMVSGGDTEWTRRALHHGYRAVYVPSAMVFHPARRTIREIRQQRIRHSKAIEAFPTTSSRLSWYVRWVSPRQGVIKRVLKKNGFRKRDKISVFGLQLVLSLYQMGLGAVRALVPSLRAEMSQKATRAKEVAERLQ
jgi:GT2 family glycosyltransferase